MRASHGRAFSGRGEPRPISSTDRHPGRQAAAAPGSGSSSSCGQLLDDLEAECALAGTRLVVDGVMKRPSWRGPESASSSVLDRRPCRITSAPLADGAATFGSGARRA